MKNFAAEYLQKKKCQPWRAETTREADCMRMAQYGLCVLFYIALSAAVGWLFYDSFWTMLVGMPGYWFLLRAYKRRLWQKREEQMRREFKELLISMAAALQAGYALENTIPVIEGELRRVFPKGRCYLAEECSYMQRCLEMKRPVEELFREVGERSGIGEIRTFAQVIAAAKSSGGNMVEIIHDTAEQMRQALQVQQEIRIAVASKALEQRIMLCMPFGIAGYLRLTNPTYLDCLYGNALGILLMSGCLAVIAWAGWLGSRILQISS